MSLNGLLKKVIPSLPIISPDKEIETLRMLPAETLFLALKEADYESALWVMENAKAVQVQGVIDLDCWKGDTFLPERFFRYFEFMTYVTPEKLKEYMNDIDPEVIVLSLMDCIEVQDFDPQNPPEVEEANLQITPDSKYALILKTTDKDLRERIYQWLNKLSHIDIDLMRRHLESLKWEQKSDLEEFGYQIKKGRIEELGFVEREEAIKFFSHITAPQLKKHLVENPLEKNVKEESVLMETLGDESFLPAPIAQAVTDEGYFRQALLKVENPHLLELLRMEVVRTVNAVFTAEDLLNEEIDTLKTSAARTRAYLDLGLLYLSGGNEEQAAEQLKTQPIFEITRLGWTLVQDLGRAAKEIKGKYSLNIFDNADRELIRGLDGNHPRVTNLESLNNLSLTAFQHFTLESLHKVANQLGSLTILAHFFQDVIGTSLDKDDDYESNESAWTRLATALFRQASGKEFSAKALSTSEWEELKGSWESEKATKMLGLIAEKVPTPARELFLKNMNEHLKGVDMLAKNPQKVETKYSHALRWGKN